MSNNDVYKYYLEDLGHLIEEIVTDWKVEKSKKELGEYDDVLFSIIRENQNIPEKEIFAKNTTRVIAESFGLDAEDLAESSMEFAKKVYEIYPQGF